MRLPAFGMLIAACLFPACADAALLRATRPGVMCSSPAALAQLSLPDGSSRTAGSDAPPSVVAIARAGGCTDFPAGNIVILQTARRNTSIVRSDTLTGDGVLDTFYVANIDYVPYVPPSDPYMDAIRAQCPARLETFAVLGVPSYEFIESLGQPVREQILKTIDDTCGGAPACTRNQQVVEIDKRRLDPQWISFVCRHP